MFTNNSHPDVYIPLATENSNPIADPFDPSRLRLSQDFVAAAGVKKILNTVPVRKPSKEWFIQTNADPSYLRHRAERRQRDLFGRAVAMARTGERIDIFA
jgi:hypothetical protein